MFRRSARRDNSGTLAARLLLVSVMSAQSHLRRPRDVPLPGVGDAEFRKEAEIVKVVFGGRSVLGGESVDIAARRVRNGRQDRSIEDGSLPIAVTAKARRDRPIFRASNVVIRLARPIAALRGRNESGKCWKSPSRVWRSTPYGFGCKILDPFSLWRIKRARLAIGHQVWKDFAYEKRRILHASPISDRRRCRRGYHHLGSEHRLCPNSKRPASAHKHAPCVHLRAGAQPVLLWPILLRSLWHRTITARAP